MSEQTIANGSDGRALEWWHRGYIHVGASQHLYTCRGHLNTFSLCFSIIFRNHFSPSSDNFAWINVCMTVPEPEPDPEDENADLRAEASFR